MTPRAEAELAAQEVLRRLSPWVTRSEVAGSIRRGKPEVKDIDIVIMPGDVSSGLFGDTRPAVEEIRELAARMGHEGRAGEKAVQVHDVLGSGLTLELWLVTPPAEWGPQLAIRTGPADFSQLLVTRLRNRLWRCEDGRVLDEHNRLVPCSTEEEFFAAARLQWIEPSQRGKVDITRYALRWE